MQKRFIYRLCMLSCVIFLGASHYGYSQPVNQACPAIKQGGILYVSAQGSPLKEGTDPTDNTLEWLPRGQKVTFLETDVKFPQLHKVELTTGAGKKLVGYLSSQNVDNCKPDLNMGQPVDVNRKMISGAPAIIPLAAIRALDGFPMGAVHYAQSRPLGQHFLDTLAQISAYLQDTVGFVSINQYNKKNGLALIDPNSALLVPNIPVLPERREMNQSEDQCSDYENYQLSLEEKNLISVMALAEIANTQGGILWTDDLKCKGLDGCPENDAIVQEVLKHLYSMVVNLANQTDRKNPYRVCIIGSKSINAFSTPAGDVCMTAGLLISLLEQGDDNQLAFASGHEICHVLLGHGEKAWRKSKAETCRSILNEKPKNKEAESLQKHLNDALQVSCQGQLDLGRIDVQLRDRFVKDYTSKIGCQNYGDDEYEHEADQCAVRLSILKKYQPRYEEFLSTMLKKNGLTNHPPVQNRVNRLHQYQNSLKPENGGFSFVGWPFTSLPIVPLPAGLFEDFKKAFLLIHPGEQKKKEQVSEKGSR